MKPYPQSLEGFDVTPLGKNVYELRLRTSNGLFIEQTGSNVATTADLKIPHRLCRIDLKHTNSSNADSTDALTWNAKRITPYGLVINLAAYSGSNGTDFVEEFGEGYEFNSTQYQINTNTTNTDRVIVIFTVQLLEGALP